MKSSSAAAPYSLQTPEWLVFLRLLCALAEGTVELAVGVKQEPHAAATAAACVSAALSDPQRRIAVMGGRDGMPRSLGSVIGGSITRFLSGFRGSASCVIDTPDVKSFSNGMAVSRDGSTLLVADSRHHAIQMFSLHTGLFLRTIGGHGSEPLRFNLPRQLWVASDGFVFVADCENHRIQVLSPRLNFHAFVGVGRIRCPVGVCTTTDDDAVVVSEYFGHRFHVFGRESGALIRVFGCLGNPAELCFLPGRRHVAGVDKDHDCVSVYTLEGQFVCHVGVGVLFMPEGVACSAANELIVADRRNNRIIVFGASGEIVWASATGNDFTGVALHGSKIFGQTSREQMCVVFS